MAFYQEVFLNEALIIFSDEPISDQDKLIQSGVDCSDWESFVESIQHKKGRFYCRGVHHSAAANWLDFSSVFKSITAAGGRVENEQEDVLMIYRSTARSKRGMWGESLNPWIEIGCCLSLVSS
jgi:hypothetical protein